MLAAILRAGNAGANNAADHLEVFDAALAQLPPAALEGEILARSDSAGASHDLAEGCCETGVRFSFGYAIDARVREAILALPSAIGSRQQTATANRARGPWVAELTYQVNLDAWPEGTRLICRRERPHPGAQLSFPDVDGHRFQCFITDQQDTDLAFLEARPRAHAIVEDRVRELKSNRALKPALLRVCRQPGVARGRALCPEPHGLDPTAALRRRARQVRTQRLRDRLLHVAGRLTQHARQLTLHLPADWPWAAAIARAFKRLAALPA